MLRVVDCLGRTLTLHPDLCLYSSLLESIYMSEKMDLDSSEIYANEDFISELEKAYHLIEKFPSTFLGPLVNSTLSIKCKNLKLKDNGFYDDKQKPCFVDLESIDVHWYPTSFDAEGDCYNHQQGVYTMIGNHTEDPSGARQSAYMLCDEMFWAFYTYLRKGTRRD